MKHNSTNDEKVYLQSFLNTTLDLSGFHHKQHVLITYTLLLENSIDETYEAIKKGILDILNSVDADISKYHETMTYGWVLIVLYFMENTKKCESFDEFIEQNQQLLDTDILYKHYSKELISLEKSRLNVLDPDIKGFDGL